MIDYETFQQIRHLHDKQGLNAAQIARALHLNWETARKWVLRPKYERRAARRGSGGRASSTRTRGRSCGCSRAIRSPPRNC